MRIFPHSHQEMKSSQLRFASRSTSVTFPAFGLNDKGFAEIKPAFKSASRQYLIAVMQATILKPLWAEWRKMTR